MRGRFPESFDPSRLRQLCQMLDLDTVSETDSWGPEDFAPILEHQLSAALEPDLADIDSEIGPKLNMWRRRSEHPLQRFSDLLAHPQPPLELLNMVKRFAKRARGAADKLLPEEVATVLYFAVIAIGVIRCGVLISRTDREKLHQGLVWAAGQDWVDRPLRTVLEKAATSLASENVEFRPDVGAGPKAPLSPEERPSK